MPTKKPVVVVIEGSPKMSLDLVDAKKIGSAAVYSILSVLLTGLVAVITSPDSMNIIVAYIPKWLFALIPGINVVLYAAMRYTKDNANTIK